MDRAKTPSKAALFGGDERGFADGFALVSSFVIISKKRNHSTNPEESTYNRNRKRDLNEDGVETNHERAGGAFDLVVFLCFNSRGENVVRFFSGGGFVAGRSRLRARSRISRGEFFFFALFSAFFFSLLFSSFEASVSSLVGSNGTKTMWKKNDCDS